MASSRYHHGDLRNALIDASIELIEEGGLASLSMAEAARRAGVSSGAPYKHFKDRAALMQGIATAVRERLDRLLEEATKNSEDPFRSMGVRYVEWAAEHPALYAVISDAQYLDEATLGRDSFWNGLAQSLQSEAPLDANSPVIRELMGRAMAQGLASLFASGVMERFGIEKRDAGRLMFAISASDEDDAP